jgi:hypothetical protein
MFLFANTADAATNLPATASSSAPTPPAADAVTVTNPGRQTSTAGVSIGTLQLSASSSGDYSITAYTASGLPTGLSINTSTGAITGRPTTIGTYSVTVTAIDSAGTEGSVSFDWTVNPSTTTDVVTVGSPGTITSIAGVAIGTLQLSASSSAGYSITAYTASDLPTGLSISSTGWISGTPTTAGTYSVTVTAIDSAGTEGSVSFDWTVTGSTSTGTTTYSGTIQLPKLKLCLDDRYNSSTPGAIVQVWRCNGSQNQQWQVLSNGTIMHNGMCLDARGLGTTNGTKVQLWSCTGKGNQQWDTSGWRIHYDNPAASGEVLDDTGWGGEGTQQDIYANNGGANQFWKTS